MTTQTLYKSYLIEEYQLTEEPFYVPIADEIELFEAAYKQKLPLIFKGPTGCGKTRFVEYMSYRLGVELTRVSKEEGVEDSNNGVNMPLVTIACHEDLTGSDLVGRYLLEGDQTVWIDGPLTRAVKVGGICYLDEVVEARKDTTVLIHPLTDHRRLLPDPLLRRPLRDLSPLSGHLLHLVHLLGRGVGPQEVPEGPRGPPGGPRGLPERPQGGPSAHFSYKI